MAGDAELHIRHEIRPCGGERLRPGRRNESIVIAVHQQRGYGELTCVRYEVEAGQIDRFRKTRQCFSPRHTEERQRAARDRGRQTEHIGEPVQPMVERVKGWLAQDRTVKIFTARVDGGEVAIAMGDENGIAHRDVHAVRYHIEQWCQKHIGQVLPITNVKDYGMVEVGS